MRMNTIVAGIATTLLLLILVQPAAASDYTLGVFGNANKDDTINMQDVTYTELIILEYKDQTQLADAKYDDRINMQDVTQIELIILGREKEMTVLDVTDRIVTINKPVERIASSSRVQDIRTICALGAADRIVGVPVAITGDDAYLYSAIYLSHPELTELPVAGNPYSGGPNLEMIASLEPDLVLTSWADADAVQEATGVPTIEAHNPEPILDFKELTFMGYVLNEQERAKELISYYNEKLDEVTEVTSGISDDEKPKVYLAFWGDLTLTPAFYNPVELAGGDYVAEGGTQGPYGPFMWQVSKEQIIAWNPDVILVHGAMTEMLSRDDVLSDPDLQSVSAIQNGTVYSTKGHAWGWDPATGVVESFYMAKLFHPEEFVDMDVEMEGDGILEEVYGADGIWTEMTERCDLHTWE
ncbi:MAG: ABC transporter substrate-binding protein [Methanosarcinales archaeon]|nr:ABC transporter substrate-binding protein [Methanosarcinales archaeon]